MNGKSRSLIRHWIVIALVFFASHACFSGRALAQKTEDLSKEAAQKATTDKAAAEKAAADKAAAEKAAFEKGKAAWEKERAALEAHRKAEEEANREFEEVHKRIQEDIRKQNCEKLPERIKDMEERIPKLNESYASLKECEGRAEVRIVELNTEINNIKTEIRNAEHNKNEAERGQLLDILNKQLNARTSLLTWRDEIREAVPNVLSEVSQIELEIEESKKQLAECKKKQAKSAPPTSGPTTPPPGKEVTKDDCDGLKEKIRTLQELLPKHLNDVTEREKITKQIEELLNRLADCPKQETIDAQFDCLKSKFPGIQRSSDKKDAASDPTSKREFAWDNDKQAWIDKDTKESICPPSGIDPCLVGTWECTSFKPDGSTFTGGGTGFRVTFKSDGTETVDYSSMRPLKAGSRDMDTFTGKASAKISTDKGVAKIEEGKESADLGVSLWSNFIHEQFKCPGLGPGGLGSSKDNNSYKCTEDSLEYQTSWLGVVYAGHHRQSYTVKLKKVKP